MYTKAKAHNYCRQRHSGFTSPVFRQTTWLSGARILDKGLATAAVFWFRDNHSLPAVAFGRVHGRSASDETEGKFSRSDGKGTCISRPQPTTRTSCRAGCGLTGCVNVRKEAGGSAAGARGARAQLVGRGAARGGGAGKASRCQRAGWWLAPRAPPRRRVTPSLGMPPRRHHGAPPPDWTVHVPLSAPRQALSLGWALMPAAVRLRLLDGRGTALAGCGGQTASSRSARASHRPTALLEDTGWRASGPPSRRTTPLLRGTVRLGPRWAPSRPRPFRWWLKRRPSAVPQGSGCGKWSSRPCVRASEDRVKTRRSPRVNRHSRPGVQSLTTAPRPINGCELWQPAC